MKAHSWGHYPPLPQTAHAVAWRKELPALLADVARGHGTTLAYGEGRSYGDSCLAESGQVIAFRGLDRFLAVDWSSAFCGRRIPEREAKDGIRALLAAIAESGEVPFSPC
jgi:hypothetical protein